MVYCRLRYIKNARETRCPLRPLSGNILRPNSTPVTPPRHPYGYRGRDARHGIMVLSYLTLHQIPCFNHLHGLVVYPLTPAQTTGFTFQICCSKYELLKLVAMFHFQCCNGWCLSRISIALNSSPTPIILSFSRLMKLLIKRLCFLSPRISYFSFFSFPTASL